jgi:phosphoribosylformimino-5-aminoimidazole carboxamide ribotide isomerase
MRILPVLDVMGGAVVRGVGGRRHEYRPVVSRLVASSAPLAVARALYEHFGRAEFYVADLDALAGSEPDWETFGALRGGGFGLWADAGVREVTSACQLADRGVEGVVVGLETVTGPAELAEAVRRLGERVVFSLDLRAGRPLGDTNAWGGADAASVASRAVRLGVRRILVLDLARVGLGGGTGTIELCASLAARFPDVEVCAGGGIRGRGDLEALRECGVRTALVASALHDGRLDRADLDSL